MKAQSELTGDRKRRAEMTRPRSGGVTNWISEIVAMSKPNIDKSARELIREYESAVSDVTTPLTELFSAIETPDYYIDKEVNHRPAGQRWPVCTP